MLLRPCVTEPTPTPITESILPTVTVVTLPPELFLLGCAPDVRIRHDLTVKYPKTTFTALLEISFLSTLLLSAGVQPALKLAIGICTGSGVGFTGFLVFLRRPSSSLAWARKDFQLVWFALLCRPNLP